MALTNTRTDSITDSEAPEIAAEVQPRISHLLIVLPPQPADVLDNMLLHLTSAFPDQPLLVAAPDLSSDTIQSVSARGGKLRLISYSAGAPSANQLFLGTADFVNTFRLAQEQESTACLMLGAECHTLEPQALQALAAAVLNAATDLAVPHYQLSPQEGLVNSAILYPVTRALYGTRPRFPLAIDLGLSLRMAERLAMCAQRYTAAGQHDAIVWPLPEAATANYTIAEVDAGHRTFPQPDATDLNSLLAQIAGSLFADVDAKASYWQRVRTGPMASTVPLSKPNTSSTPDISSMIDAFRLAYTNLADIWSLILPPNSLLGLKRLSQMPSTSFRMADQLWARIVYDFILAYRMRTINRGHLLGALTPLYLAWVASHILYTSSGTPAETHIEALATVFEADKPYLVSRWRWPDRFNP